MQRALDLIRAVTALALIVPGTGVFAETTEAGAGLVGTWTLVAAERSGEAEQIRAPRGLLILDGAGYVFEFFSAPSPGEAAESQSRTVSAQPRLAELGGFWGRYELDEGTGRITFRAEDGISPSVRGLEFTRSYQLDGDWLVVTSGEETLAQSDMRWTWQRFPVVENLSPAYRQVVGFWQHVEERQVDPATGEIRSSRRRAPSVIVYTPAGFVGVHFPPVGREPFASAIPTAEEAEAALRGYIGYFGSLGVYSGEVSHNVLAGVSPGAGSILRRYAEITGDELTVRLQPMRPPRDDSGPGTRTEVVLRRLSGAEDMLPD